MHLKGAQVRTEFFVERTVPRHFMSQAEKKHILYNILQYFFNIHIYYILIYIYIDLQIHIFWRWLKTHFSLKAQGKELFKNHSYCHSYIFSLVDFFSPRYLDTDVVVQGDLTLLASLNMRGHPAAAAEDCAQKIGHLDSAKDGGLVFFFFGGGWGGTNREQTAI